MSAIIKSLDRLQKEEKFPTPRTPAPEESAPKESLFSRFGILLWLGASISATVFSYHLGLTQGLQNANTQSPKEWLRYFSDFAPAQAVPGNPQAPALKKEWNPALAERVKVPAEELELPQPKEAEVKKQGFTIQVITYVSERLAREEAKRLSEKGHQAFVITSGKYFQVCVDLFQDKKGAVQKLDGLKKLAAYKTSYPGAYVKFLKK